MDPDTGLGTLIMRTPDLAEHLLGERASFDHLVVIRSGTATYGYALVDVDVSSGVKAGRYVHWQGDGSTQTLALSALYGGAGDIILNPTGRVGDFALPTMNGLQVVAQQAPYHSLRFSDRSNRWTALFSDSADGRTATLSITTNNLDFWAAAQALGPMPVTQLTPIARRVSAESRAQFVQSLPGIAYLTNYDVDHSTGRLDYRNLDLGFTATVSEGVSDFVGSLDSIIYAVPLGNGAGIWAVRAR